MEKCRFLIFVLLGKFRGWLTVVPGVGVEPTRKYKFRGILSPLCLPISPPGQLYGGAFQSRTELYEFAIRCITALLTRHLLSGAGNEVRTRDPNHGKVMLYQLSYSRIRMVVIIKDFFFLSTEN